MPAFKKRSYRKRAPAKKRFARGGKKSSVVSSAVKTYVNRTIHSQIENKSVQVNAGYNFGTYLESPELNAYPMLPHVGFWTINSGTNSASRIGNQIRVRKLMLNYILRPLPYDAVNNTFPVPCEVQLFLGYVKDAPTFVPTNTDFLQLYQNGASASPPQGSLRDIISVINKDFWVIKKRWTHKIGYAINNGTANQPVQQFNANNDFKLNVVKRLDITKLVDKNVRFNDNAATPTSKNLFFFQQSVFANGATGGATTQMTSIDFWIDFEYEDA
jgi:hypothetical protein